ncbi:MAG: transporter [Candidatus Cloacimonadota bacterium]|nr:MAG: transporter [Candidatus Cloacimonadota bacterium]
MIIKNKTLILPQKLDKSNITGFLKEIALQKSEIVEEIDAGNLEMIDSAGVAFLDKLMEIFTAHSPQIINLNSELEQSYQTFSSLELPIQLKAKQGNIFILLGDNFYAWLESSKQAFYLLADVFYWSFVGVFNKKGQRKGSVTQQSLLIGVDALPIILLLSFILGLILALQSAAQLRQFGANIFVADLMAISMVTEMGPILTAIILAGRSGSAIASEIATMKVTEEIDALKMMAINPIRYVVVPKFHAITLVIPLLVTASTLIGIFGGLIIAVTYLDLSTVVFFNRVFEVLTLRDALIGIGKSYFFAWVIVIIGSYYGFNAEGGAEGVGKVTTQSVVASIFWVIILDALSSMIFYF